MYLHKRIPVLINEFLYIKKLSFISKFLLDESVHLNFRRSLSIFSQMGADPAFHYLQFGHWQMGNGSNPLRSHMFVPNGELKEERIDLILITARAAKCKVDFSQDLKILILIQAESELEAEYNTIILCMHFYFIVMGTFCCCLFAVQQLLQDFPGLQFAQLLSALPFHPSPYGNNGQCSLLQPPAAPAQLQSSPGCCAGLEAGLTHWQFSLQLLQQLPYNHFSFLQGFSFLLLAHTHTCGHTLF